MSSPWAISFWESLRAGYFGPATRVTYCTNGIEVLPAATPRSRVRARDKKKG
jgi:hypothetical protein